jgi:hypothetical protein
VPQSNDLWYSGDSSHQLQGIFYEALDTEKDSLTNTVESQSIIGEVHRDQENSAYFFKCCNTKCNHKTFRRMYDLARHHDGAHATGGPAFWCEADGCERSAVQGGRSFPRKDKLHDHVRKMHHDMVNI